MTFEHFLVIQATVFGLIVGSFLNVVIVRLPLEKTLMGRSACPQCGHQIRWYENIPVMSYLFLLGRCSACKKSIPFRYPFVELLTMMFSVAVLLHVQFNLIPYFLWFLFFVAPLIAISFIDLDHQIIPDTISLPGILVGTVVIQVLFWPQTQRALVHSGLGFLVGGGFFFALASLFYLIKKQEGLGGGDIKLSAMLGTYIGWTGMVFTIMFSSIMAILSSLFIFILSRDKAKARILPYGPFLAAGALLFFFAGEPIIDWYMGLIQH